MHSTLQSQGHRSPVRSTFCVTDGFGSRGRQNFPNFAFFAIFSCETPKKVPFYTQPTAQGLHCRMLPVIPLLPCCDGRDEGVAFASRLFMRRLIGSWSSPNLSKFSPMGHACVHRLHNATIRRASAQNASFRVRVWFLEYERCCPKFWQWFSTFFTHC